MGEGFTRFTFTGEVLKSCFCSLTTS